MEHDRKNHSDARKKAEAMFGRAQSARPVIESVEDALRREGREKITRLKSLRAGQAASGAGSRDQSKE